MSGEVSAELAMRRAANDMARVADRFAESRRSEKLDHSQQMWVRGYIEGLTKAQAVIDWHAKQIADPTIPATRDEADR